jgi:hypothetical protein
LVVALSYVCDRFEFSALGSNYLAALNDAINDWNATNTQITFSQDSASAHHIGAADLGDRPLATTTMPLPPGTNFRFTNFTLQINTRYLSQFYIGPRTSTPPPDLYNLRTVIRHELGHAVGMCHTWYDRQALMYPNSYQGEVHNVDSDALSGANYIFNPSANYAMPEGGCGLTSSPVIASAGTYDDRFAEGAEGYVITYDGGPHWSRVGYTPNWYNASGQTLSYTNLAGARANIKFTGSRITRRYTMASNRGQAQIYIDGVYRETLNDQSPETRWQIAKLFVRF